MQPVTHEGHLNGQGFRFAIVASRWNDFISSRLVDGALDALERLGTDEKLVDVYKVPGAFEIPLIAAKVAGASPAPSAVICLGVILRGATTHAQHIGDVVSYALGTIALQTQVPIVHEVLLLESEQQARERCLSKKHNRGAEAALTAIEMSQLMARL